MKTKTQTQKKLVMSATLAALVCYFHYEPCMSRLDMLQLKAE